MRSNNYFYILIHVYRFSVKMTGFAAKKSPDANTSTDKGALLPSSTKASSEDQDSSNEKNTNGSLAISARHLPPVYVDIQEEIEANLEEIHK